MKKKRVNIFGKLSHYHIATIVSLIIIVLVFSFSLTYVKEPGILGFTIYESPSDGFSINDTYLREVSSGTNYWDSLTLRVGKITTGGSTEYRALIMDYNISAIPLGNTITSAKLQVYVNDSFGTSNITVKAYRVTSEWIERQATWSNRTNSVLWFSAGGDYNSAELSAVNISNQSGKYYNFTITNAVKGWVNGSYNNYGIILIAPDSVAGNYTYFTSSNDTNNAQKPKFFIDYTSNAVPIISNISTNSSLTTPILVGNKVNITVNWSDAESDSSQLFVCNSSSINVSGCNNTTFCSVSSQALGPSSCTYTVLSTDNRTTTFFTAVCDLGNCSTINQSNFFVNHAPSVMVLNPNGGETVNQSQGNYLIEFNTSDSDSDYLEANIYYGANQNSTTNLISANVNLSNNCTDVDANPATPNYCTYRWNSTGIYGTFFLTIIVNDTFTTSNDSSDSSFNIRSLTDNSPPNITAQWIETNITSGEAIQIYANVSDSNINKVWVSINTTPQTNLTMLNTSSIEYNATWIGASAGNYQFKVWANDTVGNLNNSMSWQKFSISIPNASSQNDSSPSTALPYHTIKVTGQLNASDPLRSVYAYLTVPDSFSFLTGYSQNSSLGNFTANLTKTATWFISTPLSESTYSMNITYNDYYSDQWNGTNIQVQVTSAIGGYEISVAGYPEVETSGAYFVQSYFKQNGAYTNPDSITASIYDPSGSLTWGPASMTQESTGIYNYSNTVGASVTEGQWETIINATKDSTSYYTHEFWKVVGGPFDVRTITVVSSDISSMNITVESENTGGANKDLTMNWNLTRVDTGAVLDSGSETRMIPAGSTVLWSVSPTTTYTGSVRITFLGYYSNTEKAGAYKVFTTTSGGAFCGDGTCNAGESCSSCSADCGVCPSGGGGGGGGGGVSEEKQKNLEINVDDTIYLAKNVEKTVYLEIKNTGETTLNNLVLSLGTLNTAFFTISPLKISSLKSDEKRRFEISFLITDFIGEYDFKFKVKSDEVIAEKEGKIIVTSLEEFLKKEVERLNKRADNINEKTDDKKLLNELDKCKGIISDLESNIEKEEFINAKNNIKKADNCLNDVEDKIKEETPSIKMDYPTIILIIVIFLILILLSALIAVIYIINRKLSIMNYFKSIKPEKTKSEKPEPEKSLKSKDFESRIADIEKSLRG